MKARLDKWLWSVRIYKTRTKSTDACRSGKVKVNEKTAKASFVLKIDDVVHVNKRGIKFVYKIDKIIQKRVGSPIAVTCYTDLTSPEELNKYQNWFIGKSQGERRLPGLGRPTKKERRIIDEFKSEFLNQEE